MKCLALGSFQKKITCHSPIDFQVSHHSDFIILSSTGILMANPNVVTQTPSLVNKDNRKY
jgi:hypothetical protein